MEDNRGLEEQANKEERIDGEGDKGAKISPGVQTPILAQNTSPPLHMLPGLLSHTFLLSCWAPAHRIVVIFIALADKLQLARNLP